MGFEGSNLAFCGQLKMPKDVRARLERPSVGGRGWFRLAQAIDCPNIGIVPDRYNVLLLISDQHSKFHLGAYGDPLIRTPHLDRLAGRGLRFTNAYCPSPVCSPSRMSFMTCRTPSANRVWQNSHLLYSGIPTWAHAMGAAGYETSLIGRMHFNGYDQRHGFENRPLGEYGAVHPGAPRQGEPIFKGVPLETTGQNRMAVRKSRTGIRDSPTTSSTKKWPMQRPTTCANEHRIPEIDRSRPWPGFSPPPLPVHCPSRTVRLLLRSGGHTCTYAERTGGHPKVQGNPRPVSTT